MNRGDVWQLDLGGRAGRRPAIVLTRRGVIAHLDKLTVAEITSSGKGYPTEVPLGRTADLPKDSFVQLDNIQTVAKTRFVKYIGSLDATTMRTVGRTSPSGWRTSSDARLRPLRATPCAATGQELNRFEMTFERREVARRGVVVLAGEQRLAPLAHSWTPSTSPARLATGMAHTSVVADRTPP